jgi:hypothetical protein
MIVSSPMRALLLVATLGVVCACKEQSMPDPRDAANEYAAAAQIPDPKARAAAIYALMTTDAQRERSQDEVLKMVTDEASELQEQGKALASNDARVEATARLRYEDGEEAALELKEGRYWVTSAGALPGGARTPEEAIDQLRRVVARRSYAGLMRVLSPATRAMIEADLRTLVAGLDKPDSLQVKITGETAVVTVPSGHIVKLKREGGIWRVDYFD